MRCDVLMSTSFLDEDSKSTDVSVWTPNALGSSAGKSSYKSGSLHLDHKKAARSPVDSKSTSESSPHEPGEKSKSSSKASPPHSHGPGQECDEDHFSNLREKCGDLVWECLQGLISVLDAKDFKALQGAIQYKSSQFQFAQEFTNIHFNYRGIGVH